MRHTRYILDGHDPVPEPDLMKWALWLESANRIVARYHIDEVTVSTLFLGIDYASAGEPVLFETMVFGGEHDEFTMRYSTWDEAERGHAKIAMQIREQQPLTESE